MKKLASEVTKWRKTVDDLGSQRETAAHRVDELKEMKRPLTLKAHTGDAGARKKLDAINADLMTAMQDLDDLDEAIRQANEKRAEAERAVAEAQEAERLQALSDLAEKRVGITERIEEQLHELAGTLTEYLDAGDEIQGYLGPEDDTIARRPNGDGRLGLVVGRVLRDLLPVEKVGRNPVDPRNDQAFPDMERDALSRLLLTPEGAKRMARMKVA